MGLSLADYRPSVDIRVNDRMQQGYSYTLEAMPGADFDPAFQPHYDPGEMLAMGVFEGKYCNDCIDELPVEWFERAKLSDKPDPSVNYFAVKSRQPLSVWQEKAGLHPKTPWAGFNGIAASRWVAAYPASMPSRSSAGKPSAHATRARSAPIAIRATSFADRASGRPCCNGPMTR